MHAIILLGLSAACRSTHPSDKRAYPLCSGLFRGKGQPVNRLPSEWGRKRDRATAPLSLLLSQAILSSLLFLLANFLFHPTPVGSLFTGQKRVIRIQISLNTEYLSKTLAQNCHKLNATILQVSSGYGSKTRFRR